MNLTENQRKFLSVLKEMADKDPGLYWPPIAVLDQMGMSPDSADDPTAALVEMKLIEIHPRAKDCITITELGRKMV